MISCSFLVTATISLSISLYLSIYLFLYIHRTHSSVPSMLPCRAVNSVLLGFSCRCRVVPEILFFRNFSTSPHPLHFSRPAFCMKYRIFLCRQSFTIYSWDLPSYAFLAEPTSHQHVIVIRDPFLSFCIPIGFVDPLAQIDRFHLAICLNTYIYQTINPCIHLFTIVRRRL